MVSPSSLPFAFAAMKPIVDIAPECKSLLKLAAKKLTGHDRRLFVAEVAEKSAIAAPVSLKLSLVLAVILSNWVCMKNVQG